MENLFNSPLNNQRNTLRKLIRSRRQQLNSRQQQQAANDICQLLAHHPQMAQAQKIGVYLANDGELDPATFIAWCWAQGKQTYLPVLHPFSKGHLLFLHYHQQTPMQKNKYGIAEPLLDVRAILPLQQLDLLLTPLVAFDDQGNRLGMGGGFYDRTLSRWEQEDDHQRPHSPYPIGIAHDCQQVDSIPCEHWDIPLPEIITPSNRHCWPL
jgi:5-formyltetrahydrofolate cyclo-ligase